MANGVTTNDLYLFTSDAVKLEGDSGTTPFTFQVARIGDATSEVTVDYEVNSPILTAVVDGRLPADESDFGGSFPSGTVTFAAGEVVKTITVDVTGDEIPEIEQPGIQNADFFDVTLANASDNATITVGQAPGVILNDDPLAAPDVVFEPQAMTIDNTAGASTVSAADLDGDGDTDILAASFAENRIAWYENTDGNGRNWSTNIITTEAVNAESVFASDVDGDGDPDVLAASPSNGELTWYENTDGNGGFSEARTLAADITGANTVLATDLDSDGDSDILFAGDNTVTWYENLAISADVDPSDPNGNGNGQMEILGSNPTAGQTSPWQMDGTDLMQGSSTAAMAEAITPVIA